MAETSRLLTMEPLRRQSISKGMLTIFPTEIVSPPNSLNQIDFYLARGMGGIIAYNHFGQDEHFRVLAKLVMDSQFVKDLPLLSPVAHHQYQLPLIALAKAAGVDLSEIVTRHTKEVWKKTGEEKVGRDSRREKYRRYLDKASYVLSHNGIMIISPQSGRQEKLGSPPEGKPIRNLLTESGTNNFFVVCVGLAIPESPDYSRVRTGGLNVGVTETMNIGHPLTFDELMNSVSGDIDQVDQKVFDMMAEVVPTEYL